MRIQQIRFLVFALFLALSACGASQSSPSGSTVSNEAGTNALDSDGDGLVDDNRIYVGSEPGRPASSEQDEVCGDGVDNDGDTDIDCDDAECAMLPACGE